MKKRIIAALMIFAQLIAFSGCEQKNSSKVQITMYLWDRPMSKELTPWLEKQFPEIDFTFVIGYNSMDFYTDLNDRGALPDIITCRRFSLNDAAHLSDYLMDLSVTDVVGSYYDSYIENNREPSGAIRWLPLCAEVDGYIANVDLFEENNITLPTNQAEFAEVCRRFEELGIRGYINDYRMDYSCMEALQGSAVSELMSLDGVIWRSAYESETNDYPVGLDDKAWPAVFEKFEKYLEDTRVTPDDADVKYEDMRDAFLEGKAAIMRETADKCTYFRESGINAVMLPYFGETSDDNWILTYPAFQAAVNQSVSEDEKKSDAVMRVLEAMLSEEGQKCVAAGNAMLTYNKNVNFEMGEAFSQVKDCINSNRMYMRLASTEMFSVSQDVVQKMIRREYGAQAAYEDFNSQLLAAKETSSPEIVLTQNTGYEYALGEHGNPAASAIINTYHRQCEDDILIGYASIVSSSIFKGDYTEKQLMRLLPNWVDMRSGSLTGAEVKALMEWLVNVKEDGSNPIRHKNLIPVTSGMEYTLTDLGDGAYRLEELYVNGKPLEADKVYAVSIIGDSSFIESSAYCNCPMPEALQKKMEAQDIMVYTLFNTVLEDGQQIAEPTEYVTFGHL